MQMQKCELIQADEAVEGMKHAHTKTIMSAVLQVSEWVSEL